MQNELLLIVGLPGIGKSTYIQNLIKDGDKTYTVLSSDALRAKFGTGEEDQSVTPQVFSYIHEQVNILLSSGKNVIVDATNVSKRDRSGYCKLANRYGSHVVAHVFPLDKELAMERNQIRKSKGGRYVPEFVFDKMITKYDAPELNEGINEIINI